MERASIEFTDLVLKLNPAETSCVDHVQFDGLSDGMLARRNCTLLQDGLRIQMAFSFGWLRDVSQGQFETELVDVQLTNQSNRFSGDGFLKWTGIEGARLECLTDGADQMIGRMGKGPCLPGQIIPDAYYLRLHAKTQSGETVEIERILPDNCHIRVGHPTIVWRIGPQTICSSIRISKTVRRAERPDTAYVLFDAVDIMWPRSSEFECKNPHFGDSTSKFDWLEYTCSAGSVVVQQLANGMAGLQITPQIPATDIDVNAFGLAFSFLVSRIVNVVAHESRSGDSICRVLHLPTRRLSDARFALPLGDGHQLSGHFEELLSKATNFFLTETGKEIGNLLHMCLGSVDAAFTTHALVVCVVLESLIKKVCANRPHRSSISAQQAESIFQHLEAIQLPQNITNRFRGFIDKLDVANPKNVLHEWAANGAMGLTKADINAWDFLRNSAAHGRLLWDDDQIEEKQKHLQKLHRVKNIINKILLSVMSYKGRYFDYTEWCPKEFEPTSLSVE